MQKNISVIIGFRFLLVLASCYIDDLLIVVDFLLHFVQHLLLLAFWLLYDELKSLDLDALFVYLVFVLSLDLVLLRLVFGDQLLDVGLYARLKHLFILAFYFVYFFLQFRFLLLLLRVTLRLKGPDLPRQISILRFQLTDLDFLGCSFLRISLPLRNQVFVGTLIRG